jgi:alanyl-tRNA synthetase
MQTVFPSKMLVESHKLAKGVTEFLMGLENRKTMPDGVIGLTEDWKTMFRGDVLFDMKATHGFPLDFALDRIINEHDMAVDWVAFIEAARRNGWWDFQIYDLVSHAMQDASIPKKTQDAICSRIKLYVLSYPHPRMLS